MLVVGIDAEVEDVPLRNSQMFKQLPSGVIGIARTLAAQLGGEAADGLLKCDVGVGPEWEEADLCVRAARCRCSWAGLAFVGEGLGGVAAPSEREAPKTR